MPVAPNVGVFAQLGMDPSSATSTEAYEFKSESLTSKRELIESIGMRGSRSRVIERLRQGTLTVGGQILLAPSPTELRKLLPRILGGNESAGAGLYTYALAETLPTFVTSIDRVAKVYSYTGCKVDKAIFRAAQGQVLDLELDVEALSESVGNAGTFASLTIDNTTPFVFFDGVLTLGGTAYQMMDVAITIDNFLKKDRFVNSQTRTDLPELDRSVTLECTVPYTSDTVGLYDGGASGVTAIVKFNYGGSGSGGAGKSLKFTFGNVVFPANGTPAIGAKDEITLRLAGAARKTSTTPEVAVELDNTA